MQAILNVKTSEIDESLLNIIKELLSKNVEIVIRRETLRLEEYDRTLSLDEAMKADVPHLTEGSSPGCDTTSVRNTAGI